MFQIKARIYALGKTLTDLSNEMRNRYPTEKISLSEFSLAISGKNTAPKSEKMVARANEIVFEWETQALNN